jgi:hypothetical protein
MLIYRPHDTSANPIAFVCGKFGQRRGTTDGLLRIAM